MSRLYSLIINKTEIIIENELPKGFWLSIGDFLELICLSSLFALLLNPTSVSLLNRGAK